MPMSLFKNNKNRNKVVNPYCSLGWLLIITIFQKCAKLKPPWVHLGKQNNTIIFFFTIFFFNKKVDLSSLRGGAGAPIAPPPPYGPVKSGPIYKAIRRLNHYPVNSVVVVTTLTHRIAIFSNRSSISAIYPFSYWALVEKKNRAEYVAEDSARDMNVTPDAHTKHTHELHLNFSSNEFRFRNELLLSSMKPWMMKFKIS